MMARIVPLLRAVVIAAALSVPWAATAVTPDERLADPALEARARALSQELRCLVCQNQSIDDSNAGLARDLRILLRERLVAGDSDRAVLEFMTARYGDFVLLRPPVRPSTWLLWLAPLVVLAIGALALAHFFGRSRRTVVAAPPLTTEERARLAQLLEGSSPS